MRNLLFVFIIITFFGCNLNTKIDDGVLPVTATLNEVGCSWYISSELNKKAGIKKMGALNLVFILSNPNDSPVYIPIYNKMDTMYKSKIEIYLNGKKMTTKTEEPPFIYKAGISGIEIKICDVNENNQYEGFEDVRKIISDLEFRYMKDETDSVYRKMKVGDIRFDIDEDDNILIAYEDTIFFGKPALRTRDK